MPKYSIQAPNGKTYQIDGPDGATQQQVRSAVMRQFPDAGRPTAAPRTAAARPAAARPAAPSNDDLLTRYKDADPDKALQIYQRARQTVAQRQTDPAKRTRALTMFDSDPRIQAIRQVAGLQPITTRRQDLQATARRAAAAQRSRQITEAGRQAARGRQGNTPGWMTSLSAGVRRSMFGIPERLSAAGLYYTGNAGDLNYGETLQAVRAGTDEELGRNLPANILGQITGSVASGRGVAKVAGYGADKLARAASPVLSRVGNVLQGLTRLNQGQRLRNTAKISTMGAGFGAGQAAGEGRDVKEGAIVGAIAAPVLGVGFKAIQVISRPARDFLRLSSAGRILSRLTSMTRDQLSARASAHRAATGAEPTVFELLPLADRNKILSQAVVGRDNVVEQASGAIRDRAANLGPEMSARARAILEPQRTFIERGINRDLGAARGGAAAPEDAALAARAVRSPTDMSELRDVEARAIMAPHENTRVVDNLEDLLPSVPAPTGTSRIAVDPEVSAVIRSAAGTLRARAQNAGVTAGDVADMISTLRGDLSRGGIEGRNAERAINHLQATLDEIAPEAGAATRQMTDAYAGRSRMAEGMKEGAATRMRDDVQIGTSRREARRVRNAYDTPEGAAGRSLGQGNKVLGDLSGSPEEALRATIGMSRNSIGRQLAQNVGADEAAGITAAARAQDMSAQALASASQKAQGGGSGVADAEGLVQALAALHPSTFITTKLGSVRRLMTLTYIPENRARTMVDMLFSQNPAMVQRALNAIGNEPNGATFLKYLVTTAGRIAGGNSSGEEELPAADGDVPSVMDDLGALEEPGAAEGDLPEEFNGAPQPLAPGNLPLDIQNRAQNEDGTISTVRTISIGTDQGEVLIPTVIDGKVVSDEEAIQHFKQTGENFGTFKTPEEADAYADALHNYHARLLVDEEDDQAGASDAPYGRQVIETLFPDAEITDDVRDPNSALGRANPDSYHNTTDEAVDVRPIPGMTFNEFIDKIENAGFNIIEAIDEVTHPSAHATGPHWHVVIG